jgi:3-hydroxyacyl-CoA dehydrogenase
VREGRLGAKSGGGFYDYEAGEAARLAAERDRTLLRLLEAPGEGRRGKE